MIPRYRAWSKQERRLIYSEDILAIDYENEEIDAQKIYFEDGLAVERDIYTYGFNNIELMQSTGLTDKNGKEIFEGDILCDEGLEQEDEFVYVTVSYRDGMWICAQITNDDCGYSGALNEFVEDYSVIGNTWEGGELLDVEKAEEKEADKYYHCQGQVR